MEYVATRVSAIGERAEVELEQLSALGPDEDAGDLRARQRGTYLVGACPRAR